MTQATSQRRWVAIAAATLMVTIGFWALGYGLVVGGAGGGGPDVVGSGLTLALVLVPFTFMMAAFLSRRRRASLAVLAAMALFLVLGGALLALFGSPTAALLSGQAAGAVVTVAPADGTPWARRTVAAGLVAVVVHLGSAYAPLLAAFLGPALPFWAIGLADDLPVSATDCP